jgi:hypothetical protein
MNRLNSRQLERTKLDASIKLRWSHASGELRYARGKILNYSPLGIAIEVADPIPVRSYVALDAPQLSKEGWAGWGSVRYCSLKRAKYVIGLELSGGALLELKGSFPN